VIGLFALTTSQSNTRHLKQRKGDIMAYIIEDILELAGIASFVTFITFLAMAF
jgi:hypothetical protein